MDAGDFPIPNTAHSGVWESGKPGNTHPHVAENICPSNQDANAD